MTPQLWLAVLSSSVISGVLGALIAGWFNLQSKNREYANTYYSMVLEKRIKAYEAVEHLIALSILIALDITAKGVPGPSESSSRG